METHDTTVITTLEQKSTEILNWLEQSIRHTSDFVAEQTPQYIQELLAWNFYMSLIAFAINLSLLVFGLYLVKRSFKFYPGKEHEFQKRTSYYGSPMFNDSAIVKRVVFTVVMVASLIIGLVGTTSNTDWFKIKIAPRVYLLEYALESIKK